MAYQYNKNSLKLNLFYGTTGYKELRRQNYPLPSIRTLQRRMEDFKFRSGVLHDIFPLLKTKVECMKPEESHPVLLLDEMSLKPGLQFDKTTGKIICNYTVPSSDGTSDCISTHALVFKLAGLTTRWKQTIAYEYTPNSYDVNYANTIIIDIISKCNQIVLITLCPLTIRIPFLYQNMTLYISSYCDDVISH